MSSLDYLSYGNCFGHMTTGAGYDHAPFRLLLYMRERGRERRRERGRGGKDRGRKERERGREGGRKRETKKCVMLSQI